MHDKFILMTLILFLNCIASQTNHATVNYTVVTQELKMNADNCEIERYGFLVTIRSIKKLVNICDGTLIASSWVLTTGKCGQLLAKPFEYVIMVGQSRINTESLQISEIKRVIFHPQFNAVTSDNDIALVELITAIRESAFVRYVKLPLSRLESRRNICRTATIIGWNINRPKCVNATVLSPKKCRNLYQYQPTNKVKCTVTDEIESNQTTCYRNTGGPLLCENFQYGIISLNCLLSNKLTIFTDVEDYTDFIGNIMTTSRNFSTLYLHKNNYYIQLLFIIYLILYTFLM